MEDDNPEMEIGVISMLNNRMRSGPGKLEHTGPNNACVRTASGLVAGLSAAVLLTPASVTAQVLPFHTATAITTGFEESAARTFSSFFGRAGLRSDAGGIA